MIRTLLALSCLLAPMPQDRLDKSKHEWGRWKKGSWVTVVATTTYGDKKQETKQTTTLIDVTDKGCTLKIATDLTGKMVETTRTDEFPVADGEEKVTVDGREYACTVWKATSKRAGKTVETRLWLGKDSDRGLKIATTSDGKLVMEATAVKLGEKITVAGKEIECNRLEGKVTGTTEGKVTIWATLSIPGSLAKTTVEVNMNGQVVTTTQEAVEFGEGK